MRAILALFLIAFPATLWGACTGSYPFPVNECANVTATVHIAGGSYATPYVISAPNTEYILDGDITAAGEGIAIQTSHVVLNLNGKTVTYNQTSPGAGVAVEGWSKTDIAITNGSIVQDASYDSAMPHTTLSAGIDASQTTMTVTSATGLTVGGTIIVAGDAMLQDEALTVTGISGNTLTVTRAQWGTYANAHSSGNVVYQTKSEGNVYGVGSNPILTMPYSVQRMQLSGLTLTYGSRDTDGIVIAATNSIIEHNTVNDLWGVGTSSSPHTIKNRMQGIDAVTATKDTATATNNVIQYNTINNSRHRALTLGVGDTAHDNTISTNSMATNAFGISAASQCTVYNNTITARGEHPIGISASSMGTPNNLSNVNIYGNTIDVQTTRLGEEYGGSFSTSTGTTGNYATGFVSKWGGGNVSFHDNVIVGHSHYSYMGKYSPTNADALINASTRGIQIGLLQGEVSNYYNNTVTVTDYDGTGIAEGLVVDAAPDQGWLADNSGATFRNNTVTSNILNVALGDNYGPAPGWPLFLQNTFVKADNYAAYHTIGAGLNGYFVGSGKFVSNVYQNGASQSSPNMYFGNHPVDTSNGVAWHSLLFGRLMNATVKNGSGTPLSNIRLTTHNQSTFGDSHQVTADFGSINGGTGTYTITNTTNYQAVTDANGNAQLIVYDYELTDVMGSTMLNAVQQNTYAPHTIALYNVGTSQSMFTTQAGTWDDLNSSGAYTLSGTGGSVTIDPVQIGSPIPALIGKLIGSIH